MFWKKVAIFINEGRHFFFKIYTKISKVLSHLQCLAFCQFVQAIELVFLVQTNRIVEGFSAKLYQQIFHFFRIEIEDKRRMSERSIIHFTHEALPFRQFQLASGTPSRINVGHNFIIRSIQSKINGIFPSNGKDAVLWKKDFLACPFLNGFMASSFFLSWQAVMIRRLAKSDKICFVLMGWLLLNDSF